MSKLLIKEREIVIPGQKLAEGMDFLPSDGTLREKDNIISTHIGLVDVKGRIVKVIPLNGRYIPKVGDVVIGKINEIGMSNWRIDIGWAFFAGLRISEASNEYIPADAPLSRYFDVGETVACKIVKISGTKFVDVTMKGPGLGKLGNGRVIQCNPTKVPRIIGRKGSMIHLLKDASGCRITVGQNGAVWISGSSPDKELLVEKTIKMIEERSHESGLTETISKHLEENK